MFGSSERSAEREMERIEQERVRSTAYFRHLGEVAAVTLGGYDPEADIAVANREAHVRAADILVEHPGVELPEGIDRKDAIRSVFQEFSSKAASAALTAEFLDAHDLASADIEVQQALMEARLAALGAETEPES